MILGALSLLVIPSLAMGDSFMDPVSRYGDERLAQAQAWHNRLERYLKHPTIEMALAAYLEQQVQNKPTVTSTGCLSVEILTLPHAASHSIRGLVAYFAHATSMEFNTGVMIAALITRLSQKPIPTHIHGTDNFGRALPPCKVRFFALSPSNIHLLFTAVAVIVDKHMHDHVYAMSYYARHLGIYRDHLRMLESEVLRLLDFRVWVHQDEFDAAQRKLFEPE